MRNSVTVLAAAVIAVAGPSSGAPGHHFRIAPDRLTVAPGASLQLHAAPPNDSRADDPHFKEFWSTLGPGGLDHDTGLYRAPYVVTSPTLVRAVLFRGIKPDIDSAVVVIQLEPGALPGAEDCLGPGQNWDPSGRGPAYAQLDELPEATHTVTPDYPPSARARGLTGGLIVNVLVCKSGRVLDAIAQWGSGISPIPELEDAALDAARQWAFQPGKIAGQPVASWVAVPFRFPP